MEHHFYESGIVAWCKYLAPTRMLLVELRNGAQYCFIKVPKGVVERFIKAELPGTFIQEQIAGCYPGHKVPKDLPDEPPRSLITTPDKPIALLATQSLKNIAPHLPSGWDEQMQETLKAPPVLVQVVRSRKSKHGDHQLSGCRSYSKITVNASGNPWQFVITLLHELAHAHVMHSIRRPVPPHGREWKQAFRGLLQGHLGLFSSDLQPHVAEYAQNPLFSSSAHPGLAAALRKHDTADQRLTVQELPIGEKFSPDGELILIKGERLRSWYRCTTPDGKKSYRVPPTARIHTVFRKQGG